MKKNLSAVSLGPGLSVRGLNSPTNIKKVEGIDKKTFGQSFTDKLQKIKNRPKKDSLQDMYIKGLQDQIQCLELQLKLLKEKEIAKHSQVDQLETFFGDGIPINENILALKNGFNNYKTQTDKKIQNREAQKKQRESLIASISLKIHETSQLIQQQQKKYKKELTAQSTLTHEKVKKGILLKQQTQLEEQNLKILKTENRKLIEILAGMQRAKELLLIAILRNDNHKYVKLNKLRESIAEQEVELQKLSSSYQVLKKQDDEKSYVINLQQSNIKLKKKIISLEKQLNSLHIKSQEKKMELEAKLKQRHKQINARLDMQKRLDSTKDAIEAENNMSIQQLQKTTKESELKILQSIIDKNKKLAKYTDYYGSLLTKVEEKLYEQGQKKPSLKNQLQVYQAKVKQLEKIIQTQKANRCTLKSQLASFESINSHATEIVPPMITDIKKYEDKLKGCKAERERLIQDIKLKEKQLELVEILKSLNLEEIQISSSSNSSIQDRLVDFIRNWEMLNRN